MKDFLPALFCVLIAGPAACQTLDIGAIVKAYATALGTQGREADAVLKR